MSLFDVENVKLMPKVRDMTVGPVGTSDVQEFARRYHYTGIANRNTSLWRWGLWHGPVLHGVVSYNRPTRSVCESVFGPENHEHVWHMGRLVLSDDSPRNSESRLIGGSLQAISAAHGNVWAVLTYAASDAGHIGTVYQATNAIYTGTGGDSYYFVDREGCRHSTYIRGSLMTVERAAERGWTRHRGGVKHRYVYILGSKTQRRQRRALLRYPVLPYPKTSVE
jgi:hypothetical protein